MLVSAAVVLIVATVRLQASGDSKVRKRTITSIGLLALVIGLMLTPLSSSIWRVMPEMAFLQFPWRLTAVLAAAVCCVIQLAVGPVRLKPTALSVGAVVLVAAMSWPAVHPFRQDCDEEDNVSARLAVFQAKTGTDPTDEYTTGEADNDSLLHADPPFWLAQDPEAHPPQTHSGPVPMHFVVDAEKAEALVLNLREYPAWIVRVNGVEVKDRIARADGLIAFAVVAGRSRIDIEYATTEDRRLGDGISLVALCGTLGLAVAGRRRWRSHIVKPRIIRH